MSMRQTFYVWWLISSIWSIYALSDSKCAHTICINGTYLAGSLTYEIRVKRSVGWVGLGFGQRMANTYMTIMWDNEDGTRTLSQRYSKGYSEPKLVSTPKWDATLVLPVVSSPANSTTFAFNLSVNEAQFNSKFSAHSVIWAYSHHRPSSPDPSSTLQYHNSRGVFRLDFGSHPDGNPPPNDRTSNPLSKVERVMFLHGCIVSFGFLAILPTGVMIARYTRTFTTKWVKAHQMCNMVVGLPIITLGVIFGTIVTLSNGGEHLGDVHKICGIILLVMVYIQAWLGTYIHQRSTSKSSTHPKSNIIHVILGLLVIGSSTLQIRGGLYEWEAKTGRPVPRVFIVLWKASPVVLLLTYVGGFAFLPRQFRQENDAATLGEQYIALSEGPYSPLSRMNITSNAEEDGLEVDE